MKLIEVIDYLEATYHLAVRDVFYGSIPLFMEAIQGGKDRR